MWIVAYQIKFVDHRDVVGDYPTEEEARKWFERIKTFTDLKFVRLEHDEKTVEFYRPE